MPYNYEQSYFDPRGLPATLRTADQQRAYRQRVERELADIFGLPRNGNEPTYGFVIGSLLLQERFDAGSSDFRESIDGARKVSLVRQRVRKPDGSEGDGSNRDYIRAVAEQIPTIPGHGERVSFQELASVAQFAIDRAGEVMLGDPNFGTQVRVGLDRYVGGDPLALPLDLQGLDGGGGDDEIVAENVYGFAKVFRGYYMERMRVLDAVDRIVELWNNGLLAIGNDGAGRLLDTYAYTTEDFLSPAGRQMTYGRMLGTPGAEVSKEVQPNREFEQLFMRFISSIAEYERQRRVSDILGQARSAASLSSEQVRKSGRDLAANCSLYGWGGAHFAAKRIEAQLGAAVAVLKQPAVQRAYGATTPLQVIERVSAKEFGQVPNLVKFRTMADSGKAILDIVAKYAAAWTSTAHRPLFRELPEVQVGGNGRAPEPDIPDADRDALMRHTQYILAVQGVNQEQVDRLSQPADVVYAPSLPSFDGAASAPAAANNGASATIDRLRQMVASGTPPTIDQLQQLLPAGR